MIKFVKNDFFIYCKEARIENQRSFYGSFCLGPFEAGQSITIANALRRTLLSELKGLAITSAEIEGVFHEYATLPGVRDSILDILLNLKDIVLKTINYGNKKKGTSYTATFKNEQIGYLKSRGPYIITAADLKLPPGIQCVDPAQYIATLSEEGILNIKFTINEGKNYHLSYADSSEMGYGFSESLLSSRKDSASLGRHDDNKQAITKNSKTEISDNVLQTRDAFKKEASRYAACILTSTKKIDQSVSPPKAGANKSLSNSFTTSLGRGTKLRLKQKKIPGIAENGLGASQGDSNLDAKRIEKGSGVKTINNLFFYSPKSGLKRFWLKKIKKIQIEINKEKKNSSFSGDAKFNLIPGNKINNIILKELGLLIKKKMIKKKIAYNHFKFATLSVPGIDFFKYPQRALSKNGLGAIKGKGKYTWLVGHKAIIALSTPLAIDAVFMPVNKVNYIIEINEQSVIAKDSAPLLFQGSHFLKPLSSSKQRQSNLEVFLKEEQKAKASINYTISEAEIFKKPYPTLRNNINSYKTSGLSFIYKAVTLSKKWLLASARKSFSLNNLSIMPKALDNISSEATYKRLLKEGIFSPMASGKKLFSSKELKSQRTITEPDAKQRQSLHLQTDFFLIKKKQTWQIEPKSILKRNKKVFFKASFLRTFSINGRERKYSKSPFGTECLNKHNSGSVAEKQSDLQAELNLNIPFSSALRPQSHEKFTNLRNLNESRFAFALWQSHKKFLWLASHKKQESKKNSFNNFPAKAKTILGTHAKPIFNFAVAASLGLPARNQGDQEQSSFLKKFILLTSFSININKASCLSFSKWPLHKILGGIRFFFIPEIPFSMKKNEPQKRHKQVNEKQLLLYSIYKVKRKNNKVTVLFKQNLEKKNQNPYFKALTLLSSWLKAILLIKENKNSYATRSGANSAPKWHSQKSCSFRYKSIPHWQALPFQRGISHMLGLKFRKKFESMAHQPCIKLKGPWLFMAFNNRRFFEPFIAPSIGRLFLAPKPFIAIPGSNLKINSNKKTTLWLITAIPRIAINSSIAPARGPLGVLLSARAPEANKKQKSFGLVGHNFSYKSLSWLEGLAKRQAKGKSGLKSTLFDASLWPNNDSKKAISDRKLTYNRGTLLPTYPHIKYPLSVIQKSLKNNIIIEIWTNGSIHPRQALYDACKNLLSIFSKLEKARFTRSIFQSEKTYQKIALGVIAKSKIWEKSIFNFKEPFVYRQAALTDFNYGLSPTGMAEPYPFNLKKLHLAILTNSPQTKHAHEPRILFKKINAISNNKLSLIKPYIDDLFTFNKFKNNSNITFSTLYGNIFRKLNHSRRLLSNILLIILTTFLIKLKKKQLTYQSKLLPFGALTMASGSAKTQPDANQSLLYKAIRCLLRKSKRELQPLSSFSYKSVPGYIKKSVAFPINQKAISLSPIWNVTFNKNNQYFLSMPKNHQLAFFKRTITKPLYWSSEAAKNAASLEQSQKLFIDKAIQKNCLLSHSHAYLNPIKSSYKNGFYLVKLANARINNNKFIFSNSLSYKEPLLESNSATLTKLLKLKPEKRSIGVVYNGKARIEDIKINNYAKGIINYSSRFARPSSQKPRGNNKQSLEIAPLQSLKMDIFLKQKQINWNIKMSLADYNILKTKPELIDIGKLNISLRPYTCLKRANINSLGDLLKKSRKELLSLKNFGKQSLKEVEENLQQLGLSIN